jgi:hypothetical protein
VLLDHPLPGRVGRERVDPECLDPEVMTDRVPDAGLAECGEALDLVDVGDCVRGADRTILHRVIAL